jgi:23S rRNA U2552 (ribose-2'-O)-methylase RlmE/FtsJ
LKYTTGISRAFRGTQVNVVEFGVSQGGSLQMWKNYFGSDVKLFGVDINPNCKQFEEPGVRIFIGDQANREFLRTVASAVPRIDIAGAVVTNERAVSSNTVRTSLTN